MMRGDLCVSGLWGEYPTLYRPRDPEPRLPQLDLGTLGAPRRQAGAWSDFIVPPWRRPAPWSLPPLHVPAWTLPCAPQPPRPSHSQHSNPTPRPRPEEGVGLGLPISGAPSPRGACSLGRQSDQHLLGIARRVHHAQVWEAQEGLGRDAGQMQPVGPARRGKGRACVRAAGRERPPRHHTPCPDPRRTPRPPHLRKRARRRGVLRKASEPMWPMRLPCRCSSSKVSGRSGGTKDSWLWLRSNT